MRNSLSVITFLFFPFASLSTVFGGSDDSLISQHHGQNEFSANVRSKELALTSYQLERLGEDYPIIDIALANGEAWIAGRKHLWRWTPEIGKLQKISLPNGYARDPVIKIHIREHTLFVASKNAIQMIDFNSEFKTRIHRIDAKNKKGSTVGLSGLNQNVWWFLDNSIARIDEHDKIHFVYSGPVGSDMRKFWFDSANMCLWAIDHNLLTVRDFRHSEPKTKLVYRSTDELDDIAQYNGQIFINTGKTVLRFDSDYRLTQAIPVENERFIIAMDLQKETHAYLFEDHLVEIYDMQKEQRVTTYINLTTSQKIKRIFYQNNLLIVLSDLDVRAFSILTEMNLAGKGVSGTKG